MSSGSRSKSSVRGAKPQVRGAKARRAPVRSQTSVPIMAIVVGGILLALFVGLLIYGAINSKNASGGPPAVAGSSATIKCDQLEQTQVHYHAALQIMYQGNVVNLPAGTGIQGGETAPQCFYWLHVHQSSPNVIHIESPAKDTFTLGDFIKVWDTFNNYNGKPAIKLDSTHVTTFTLQPGESIVTYVDLNDGKGPTVYEGDPNKIVLKSHETITIEITSSQFPTKTPPTINWKASPYTNL
jgi:hypothetical protein